MGQPGISNPGNIDRSDIRGHRFSIPGAIGGDRAMGADGPGNRAAAVKPGISVGMGAPVDIGRPIDPQVPIGKDTPSKSGIEYGGGCGLGRRAGSGVHFNRQLDHGPGIQGTRACGSEGYIGSAAFG